MCRVADTYNEAKVWVGVIIVYENGGGVIYWLDVAMTELLLGPLLSTHVTLLRTIFG